MGLDEDRIRIAKPYHDEEIERSVISVLRSSRLVQGAQVKKFEDEIAKYVGSKHAIALNSGTAAIHAALEAIKNGKNSTCEVITTPLSFSATANAILHAGCKPIFVDVNEETFNIDPCLIEERVSEDTIAIEPVDVYGLPAELDPILKIANSRGISVVEDAAEAIGASYLGRKVGSISTITCFSTYATKNMHTGEGGFVTTNEDNLAEHMRVFRNQGQVSKYNQTILGCNYRMPEISAAIGLRQIPLVNELNSKRREHAMILRAGLHGIDGLGFQRVDNVAEHAWYMFALKLDERKTKISRHKLIMKLNERGIDADIAWPTPIHLQPYYRAKFRFKLGDYPRAEKICKSVFQIPIQPFLSTQDLDRIVSTVKELLAQ